MRCPGPVVFPLHPRTRARLRDAGLLEELAGVEGLHLSEPLGYLELAALLCQARAVVTDSGGVQKEAYLAGVPCVTLRANTEWVETVQSGWNTLVDLDAAAALAALTRQPPVEHPQLYGDGHAAERCVRRSGRSREPPPGQGGERPRAAPRRARAKAAPGAGAGLPWPLTVPKYRILLLLLLGLLGLLGLLVLLAVIGRAGLAALGRHGVGGDAAGGPSVVAPDVMPIAAATCAAIALA